MRLQTAEEILRETRARGEQYVREALSEMRHWALLWRRLPGERGPGWEFALRDAIRARDRARKWQRRTEESVASLRTEFIRTGFLQP